VRRLAPRLGEHTRQVLRELGCDDAEIARLKAANVIGTPADQDEPVPAHAS